MIYLENITSGQTIYIPKNTGGVNPHKGSYEQGYEDGFASGETHQKNLLSSITFTENGEYARENGWSAVTVDVPQTGSTATLEEKSVTISADTTVVLPSSGFDGMSAVTIDAEQYAQDNYDGGFEDGFQDGYTSGSTDGYDSGYTSGHTDGVAEEKAKLSATTFTTNTAVTISDGGYSAITVNVPQTGHTDQELEEAYQSGHTEGMADQKLLLVSTAFTENGEYSIENGWSAVTVNTPQPTGNTVESNKIVYAGALRNFIVYPTKDNVIVTEIIEKKQFSLEVSGITSNDYVFLGYFRDTSVQSNFEGFSIFYSNNEFYVDTAFSFYPYTASTSSNVLTITFQYATYEWFGNGDGNSYDMISGLTFTINPSVSSTEAVVTMSNDVQSIYPYQYGVEYLRGVVVSCADYVNSARTESYTSGFTSGYTDGYSSGFTNGFYSGSTAGYIGGLESALYGAYYPIDSATNKSYCTYFPDLEEGKSIYFDIVSTSNRQANRMFGGDYYNRDEHYLMVGFDQSNREIDFQLNAKGTPSGITTNAYLTLFNPTSGSIIYNPNQRICGEIAVTDTECNYGVACLGFVPNKYTVQGDFTGPYPIKFNQDFASAFTLCKIVYTDIATGEIEHYFSFDKEANEIRDWITGDIAPTYDYNGNRAYGVLESKKM